MSNIKDIQYSMTLKHVYTYNVQVFLINWNAMKFKIKKTHLRI